MNRDRTSAILISTDVTGGHWQLGTLPPPRGAFALVGWTDAPENAGVPLSAVRTLARALTAHGCVTFPSSHSSPQGGSGWNRGASGDFLCQVPLGAPSQAWRAAIYRLGAVRNLDLLCTSREEVVPALFDDEGYPWWLQGQFALLSPGAVPPRLTELKSLPAELFDSEWASSLSSLEIAGVDGIIRPGVDGDVIGIVTGSRAIQQEMVHHIRCAAADFDLECRCLPEAAFMEALSRNRGAT